MGGAAQAMATGGQAHSHRPVSAMPTPSNHHSSNNHHHHSNHSSQQHSHSNQSNTGDVFASAAGMNPAYSERRASAHPTMSTASSNSNSSGIPITANNPLPTSPSALDATSRSALSSGIPLTSPAALSYFAAHPRRQQVHFGSYLLLQTLGEGEFGKVKLGVHKEWGEEVAVKLIKRDKVVSEGGNSTTNVPLQLTDGKDPVKMTKVEREIQVLKVSTLERSDIEQMGERNDWKRDCGVEEGERDD